jgi:hypothetical protein
LGKIKFLCWSRCHNDSFWTYACSSTWLSSNSPIKMIFLWRGEFIPRPCLRYTVHSVSNNQTCDFLLPCQIIVCLMVSNLCLVGGFVLCMSILTWNGGPQFFSFLVCSIPITTYPYASWDWSIFFIEIWLNMSGYLKRYRESQKWNRYAENWDYRAHPGSKFVL